MGIDEDPQPKSWATERYAGGLITEEAARTNTC